MTAKLGEWTWCHCWVPLQGAIVVGRVTTTFGGSGRGAIAGCHCSVLWLGGHFSSTLTTPKLVFAIWGLCWYNFFIFRIFMRRSKCMVHETCFDYSCEAFGSHVFILLPIRGEGNEPLWWIGRGTMAPLQGAVDVVTLLGAILECHCSVLADQL